MNDCVYPNWEGGLEQSHHIFDKDGCCIVCGKYDQSKGEVRMSKHVCKWEIKEKNSEMWVECVAPDCSEWLTYSGVLFRLNEYETLKATNAELSVYCPECGSCGEVGCCGIRCLYVESQQGDYDDLLKENDSLRATNAALLDRRKSSMKLSEKSRMLFLVADILDFLNLDKLAWKMYQAAGKAWLKE